MELIAHRIIKDVVIERITLHWTNSLVKRY